LKRVARALRLSLKATREVTVLLETTAGQGHCLGGRFEHLAEIISMLDGHERLGVCFDTCHVFAAGYDIRSSSGLEKVLKRFDKDIGLDRLLLFHLNDSKGELGSRLDRHEHIGEGCIGPGLFHRIVRARRFKEIPKIIETPGGVEGGINDVTNVQRLFMFAATPAPRQQRD
ncbi:MAG: deoxyribonuclease IV, partial [Planctomycetota bacterium]